MNAEHNTGHDTSDSVVLTRENFMWIKGNAKVTISKIKESYLSQIEGDPVQSISLKMGTETPPDTAKIDDLNLFHDRVVVFKAEPGQEGHSRPAAATPLPLPIPLAPSPSHSRVTPNSATLNSPASRFGEPTPLPSKPTPSDPTASPFQAPKVKVEDTAPMGIHPSRPSVKAEPTDDIDDQGLLPRDDVEADDNNQSLQNVYLQQLAQETSTEKLERGVQKGLKLLDQLKQTLSPAAETEDGRAWLSQIEAIQTQAARARTVVGVVGNTGSGKSSCINSLLDYERLVPTNCMRACTAVVTEMSYNDSNDEASRFRAEIEFIKPEEWEKELKILFDEIIDASGNISREVYNGDSDAGVAYAKIRAVYFKHTKDDLTESSVEKLMREQNVRAVLGSTKQIKERDCDSFYKRLQHYVDSKEKPETTKKLTEEEKKKRKPREMEFWPLIKVVRIYVKADALSVSTTNYPILASANPIRLALSLSICLVCTTPTPRVLLSPMGT